MSKINHALIGMLTVVCMASIMSAASSKEEVQSDYNLTEFTITDVLLDRQVDPELYPVAGGDLFALNIIMTPAQYFLLTVSPTGDLLIPGVGIVDLADQNLSSALENIHDICRERFPRAEVYATLQQPRSFKVYLQPAGHEPLVVIANPSTRVLEVYLEYLLNQRTVDAAGNQTIKTADNLEEDDRPLPFTALQQESDLASPADELTNPSFPVTEELKLSLRRITIHRQNMTLSCDLLKAHMIHDEQQNPYLREGDLIEIPRLAERYRIGSGVLIPGIYEWAPGCTIAEAIAIAGGLETNAVESDLVLHRFTDDTTDQLLSLSGEADRSQLMIQPDDFLRIPVRSDYHVRHYAEIAGEITYPGVYAIDQGTTTVGQLLKTAGGVTDRANPVKLIIIPRQEDFETSRLQGIPFTDLADSEKSYIRSRTRVPERLVYLSGADAVNRGMDYILMDGDQLFIPEQELFVEMVGSVNNPGRYPFVPEYSASDYISLAGGRSGRATRRVYVIKPETGVKRLVKDIDAIQPGDVIFVEEKPEVSPWERFKDIVTITSGVVTMIAVVISLGR